MKRWNTPFPRGEYVDDARVQTFCKQHEFTTAVQVVQFDALTIVAYKATRLCFLRNAWDKVPVDGVLLMYMSPTNGPARYFCASKRELEAAFGEVTEVPKCWDKSPFKYSWLPGTEPPATAAFLLDSDAEPAPAPATSPVVPYRVSSRSRHDLPSTGSPASAIDFGRAWWARRVFVGVDSREYLNEVARWRDLWKPDSIRFLLVAESHVAEHPDDYKVVVDTTHEDLSYLGFALPQTYVRLIYCLGYGDNSICRPSGKVKGTSVPLDRWLAYVSAREPCSATNCAIAPDRATLP